MKRLLLCILLLSNLCAGMAAAWDDCPEALLGHDAVLMGLADDGEHNQSSHCNDHCCHGTVHLLGIGCNADSFAKTSRHSVALITDSSFALSQYIAPLLRPPIL